MTQLLCLIGLFIPLSALATETTWPGADVLVAEQHTEITVAPDGSSEEVTATTFQPVSEKGRVSASIQRIGYRSSREKLEITEAYVITFGKKFPLEHSKILDQAVASTTPGLTDVHQMTVPFEGVMVGSQIKLTYKRKTKAPSLPGSFSAAFIYGLGAPELNSTVKIRSLIPLAHQARDPHSALRFAESKEGAWNVYSITMNNPVYVELPSEKRAPAVAAIVKQAPLVQYTTATTWKELSQKYIQKLIPLMMPPLPPEARALVASVASKSAEEKISTIRRWISDHVTYSGRWTSETSDFIPRPVDEILRTKVGDCKDFAFLFIRMAKEAGFSSYLTVVNTNSDDGGGVSGLVDPEHPLPAPNYFNHAVARVRLPQGDIFVDPTVPLAQGRHTDIHLSRKPAWVIEPETVGYQKIPPVPLVNSKVTTTLVRSVDGFKAKSSVVANGAFAQYLQSLQLGSLAKDPAKAVTQVLGYGDADLVTVAPKEPFDRTSANLNLNLDYFTKEGIQASAGAFTYKYPTILQVLLQQNPLSGITTFDNVPLDLVVTTDLPEQFARDEWKSDCVTMGSILSYTRRVVNLDDRVSIREHLTVWPDDSNMGKGDKARDTVKYFHIQELVSCMKSAALDLVPRNRAAKTQISFDSTIDPNPQLTYDHSPEKLHINRMREWRRLTVLNERFPKNEVYLFKLGSIYARMGMINGGLYVPQYVMAGQRLISQGLILNPKSALGWSDLADVWLNLNDDIGLPQAKAAYQRGLQVDAKDSNLLQTGGEIALREDRIEDAIALYTAAEASAKDENTKVAAIEGEVEALCWKRDRCKEAVPVIDRRLKYKMNAWQYHNFALHYKRMDDLAHAVEFERKALAIMKFGVAESTLAELLSLQALDILSSQLMLQQKIVQVEPLVQEAVTLEPDGLSVKFAVLRLAVAKAKQDRDPVMVARARTYLSRLKDEIDEKSYQFMDRDIAALEQVAANQARAPAAAVVAKSTDGYDSLFAKYKSDTTTEAGRRYDDEGTQSLGPAFSSAIKSCLFNGGVRIESMLEIDGSGHVISWTNKTDTPESLCIAGKMIGAQGKAPPSAPFHLWVQMNIGGNR